MRIRAEMEALLWESGLMVYVDPLMKHGWKLRGRYVPSCHLMADEVEELLLFGERIGLKRQWLQGTENNRVPHFDLVASKRSLAVCEGAKELNMTEAASVIRWWHLRKAALRKGTL